MLLEQVKVGDMVTVPHESIQSIKKFECKILTIPNIKIPLAKGQDVIIHSHSVDVPGGISKIIGLIDKKSGNTSKKRARHRCTRR